MISRVGNISAMYNQNYKYSQNNKGYLWKKRKRLMPT